MTKVLKIKKIKPLHTRVLLTAERYSIEELELEGILIDVTKVDTLKEYQKVVAVGPYIKEYKEGDLVAFNPTAYAVKSYKSNGIKQDATGQSVDEMKSLISYNFPLVEVDDKIMLYVDDRDIDFVVEEFEEVEKEKEVESSIIIPGNNIITDNKIIGS